jgi:hypothetical protein
MDSAFCSYLKKQKVYLSQAALGIVDARIIGVFLQANPILIFRDDLKEAIMEVMADGRPISIFPKIVNEASNDNTNVRFTNDLVVQVVIADPKKAGAYTQSSHPKYSFHSENRQRLTRTPFKNLF